METYTVAVLHMLSQERAVPLSLHGIGAGGRAMIASPPLVLLPGLDGTGALFEPFRRAWSGMPLPVVVDYPRSEFLTYEELLPRVLERIPGGEPAILVAESFSGPLAILLAARHPERVRALVLCASFASAPRGGGFGRLIQQLANLAFRVPAPRWAVHQVLLNGSRDGGLLDEVCANKRRVRAGVMAARLRMVLACDVRRELSQVRCPVLYLRPMHDRVVPASAGREIRAILPGVRVKELPGPHFLLQARPREAADAVRALVGESA